MKKLFANICLCFLAICLYATSCDFRSLEEKQQEEISFFIMIELEEGLTYEPMAFSKVDAGFLMRDGKIRSMLSMVRDTVRMKLDIAKALSLKDHKVVGTLAKKSTKLDLSGLDELVFENVQLDQLIRKQLQKRPTIQKIALDFESAVAQMDWQLNTINDKLGDFNLSIYHLDFENPDTDLFYHQYLIQSASETQSFQKIFELDKNTVQIRTVKDVLL